MKKVECIYCFKCFKSLMKQEARVFEIASLTNKISANYRDRIVAVITALFILVGVCLSSSFMFSQLPTISSPSLRAESVRLTPGTFSAAINSRRGRGFCRKCCTKVDTVQEQMGCWNILAMAKIKGS